MSTMPPLICVHGIHFFGYTSSAFQVYLPVTRSTRAASREIRASDTAFRPHEPCALPGQPGSAALVFFFSMQHTAPASPAAGAGDEKTVSLVHGARHSDAASVSAASLDSEHTLERPADRATLSSYGGETLASRRHDTDAEADDEAALGRADPSSTNTDADKSPLQRRSVDLAARAKRPWDNGPIRPAGQGSGPIRTQPGKRSGHSSGTFFGDMSRESLVRRHEGGSHNQILARISSFLNPLLRKINRSNSFSSASSSQFTLDTDIQSERPLKEAPVLSSVLEAMDANALPPTLGQCLERPEEKLLKMTHEETDVVTEPAKQPAEPVPIPQPLVLDRIFDRSTLSSPASSNLDFFHALTEDPSIVATESPCLTMAWEQQSTVSSNLAIFQPSVLSNDTRPIWPGPLGVSGDLLLLRKQSEQEFPAPPADAPLPLDTPAPVGPYPPMRLSTSSDSDSSSSSASSRSQASISSSSSEEGSRSTYSSHGRASVPSLPVYFEEDMAVARMVSENEEDAIPPHFEDDSPCTPVVFEPPSFPVTPTVEEQVDDDAEEVVSIQEIVYPAHFFRSSSGPRSGDLASLRSSKRSSHFRMTRSASFSSESRSSLFSKDTEDLPDAAQFLANARTTLLNTILRTDDRYTGDGFEPSENWSVVNRRKLAIQMSPAYAETRRGWTQTVQQKEPGMWDSFSSGAAAFAQRLGRKLGSRRPQVPARSKRGLAHDRIAGLPHYHPHFFDEKPVGQLYKYRGGVLEGDWLLRKTLENATLCAAETSVRALSEFADYSTYLNLYSQALRREKESEGRCIRWRPRTFERNTPSILNPFRTLGDEWTGKAVVIEAWTHRRQQTQFVRKQAAAQRATESLPASLEFPTEPPPPSRAMEASKARISNETVEHGATQPSIDIKRKSTSSLASLTKGVSKRVLQNIDKKLESLVGPSPTTSEPKSSS